MFSRCLSALAIFALPTVLFAQSDAYQTRYASNLNIGDSMINIMNTGVVNGYSPAGDICANVYVYGPYQHVQACCSCLITPNGLFSLSARKDLLNNTLSGKVPTSIVIKLTATKPSEDGCDAASPGGFVPGMRAWGTTLHTVPGGYALTETAFAYSTGSSSEFAKLTTQCSEIQDIGAGSGICSSCRAGGLATPKL
ncbi:MAG: hypothetical protein JO210_07240 [Acidobacteriaceae bacterium]|nr:hypothetical protein [Acidobacteriaceae bacterium]